MSSDPTPAEAPLGRVAVLGLGVMGGSLCRALRDTGLAERVTGWSPEPTERDAAQTARAVDFAASEWRAAVQDADLVVLAAPLEATTPMLADVAAHTGTAVITDVASLKSPIAAVAREVGAADRWVGSHPMAGSERSGFWASRADLYQGATVWLCGAGSPDATSEAVGPSEDARARVTALWRGVGGIPAWTAADTHDELMALASQLPQLVANALAEVLYDADVDRAQLGPGGRDMTRLASSNPVMWKDLLTHASPALAEALRALGASAERIAEDLERGDVAAIADLMDRTGQWGRT